MRSDSIRSEPIFEYPDRRNILIVGDVGVGKSSLVNLIAGEDRAQTSASTMGCTCYPQGYTVSLGDIEFALYNTAGLHEAQGNMKKTEYLRAVFQAYELVSELERSGGISLLVFCVKGGRISITSQQTYSLFVEVLCNRQIPVVIVVTHLEMHDPMEGWWKENEKDLKEYGFIPVGHACVTTTRGYRNVFGEQYEESRVTVRKLLLEYSGRVAWKEEKASWAKRALTGLSPRPLKQLDRSDLMRKLVKRCGFSREDAELVIQHIEEEQRFWDALDEDRP